MAKMQGNPEYKDNIEGLAREPATPEIFNMRFQVFLNNDAYLKQNKLDKTGDVKDVTATFTEAEERENIRTGEKLSVIFGKISKFFSALKTVAFTGSYKDLKDKPTADDFELGNVDNTSDAEKPVSTAQQKALDAKAPLASPDFTGIPTTPTASAGTNTTQIANTAFVQSAVSNHNSSVTAHDDIRNLISGLSTRLNALADSDDTTLDQLSEIVAYIKSNRTLIETITTNKVNVADIVDNLTSAAANKPLSAQQGKVLNDLISAVTATIPVTVRVKGNAESAYRTGDVNITPANIGLGNVDNTSDANKNVASSNFVEGNYMGNGGAQPPSFIPSKKVRFAMMNNFSGTPAINTYMDCVLMDTYSGGDVPWVTAIGVTKENANPRMFIFNGQKGNTSEWSHQAEVITSKNIVSQSVANADTVDGKHASELQNYNNLTNKPMIPTKVSQLMNDSGYKTTDTTYNPATQSANGLMSAADKKKLDNAIKVNETYKFVDGNYEPFTSDIVRNSSSYIALLNGEICNLHLVYTNVTHSTSLAVNAWLTIGKINYAISNIVYGTCVVTDTGQIASGYERCAARINGNEIQVTTPKAFNNHVLIIDISWLL